MKIKGRLHVRRILAWEDGSSVDWLRLREHVGMLSVRSLDRGKPLKSCAFLCSLQLDLYFNGLAKFDSLVEVNLEGTPIGLEPRQQLPLWGSSVYFNLLNMEIAGIENEMLRLCLSDRFQRQNYIASQTLMLKVNGEVGCGVSGHKVVVIGEGVGISGTLERGRGRDFHGKLGECLSQMKFAV